MKKLVALITASALVAPLALGQNLLVNGDFNTVDPLDSNHAAGWFHWAANTGWSVRETLGPAQLDPNAGSHGGHDNTGIYDGTPQLTVGAISGENYSGAYQDNIPAAPGKTYRFAFDSGAEAWWLPWGECNVVFFDASHTEIIRTTLRTCDSLNNAVNGGLGDFYDVGIKYQRYSFLATAPAGTESMKAEIVMYGQANGQGTWGGGNLWMDNASLVEVRPITGHVTLGDWTAASAGMPVKLGVYQNNALVEMLDAKLDATGNYSVATTATGSVTVVAKASHWLGKAVDTTLGTGPVDFSLVNGDVDGDNAVTVFDYNGLSSAFDSSAGDGNWNPEADLDGDGAVTVFDYNVLSANFDLAGD